MGLIPSLIVFTPGTDILASEANSNNQSIRDTVNTSAVLTDVAREITVAHTINPTAPGAPLVLGANAQGQKVVGLNADQLDGIDGATFARRDVANTFAASQVVQGSVTAGTTGATPQPSLCGPGNFALAAGATRAVMVPGTPASGVLLASEATGGSAIYLIDGPNGAATLAAGDATVWATTDVANRNCLFWTGTEWRLKNNRGSTRTYAVVHLATLT